MVFGTSVDLQEVINCANFCVFRMSSLGAMRGRKWGFPIETWPGPYNIATRCRAGMWCKISADYWLESRDCHSWPGRVTAAVSQAIFVYISVLWATEWPVLAEVVSSLRSINGVLYEQAMDYDGGLYDIPECKYMHVLHFVAKIIKHHLFFSQVLPGYSMLTMLSREW
jgi:hypothetical protein